MGTASGGIEVRAAAAADLDRIRELASAYGNLSFWPARPDYIDHELAHGRLLVAEDGGGLAGFGAVLSRTGVAHLSDLFVARDRLGQGIGRAIMAELFEAGEERTTFASSDSRALPLYVRFGMRPTMPLLYLLGDTGAAARVPDPELGSRVVEDLADVIELDASASARRRPQEHEFLSAAAGASALVVPRAGRPRGYGWIRLVSAPDGEVDAEIGPFGAENESAAHAATLALVRKAAARAGRIHVAVPGPNPALPELLAAGFRIVDRDTCMSSRLDLIDGCRYAPSPDLG